MFHKLYANQSLGLLSLIAGMGIALSSHAEDNLRLPYDQPSADFIAPPGKADNRSQNRAQTRPDSRLLPVAPPTQNEMNQDGRQQQSQQQAQQPSYFEDPRQTAPVAQSSDNLEFLRGKGRLTGQECRGLQNGQYAQVYSLYTLIYKQDGKIFIQYPTFTLREEIHVMADRYDARQDNRPVYQSSGPAQPSQQFGGYNNQPNYGNQQQFSQNNEPDLYAQFRGQGPLQQQMPAQVSQNIGQQAMDPWGRPMFDAYGRPLMQQQLLSLQMQQIQQQQQQRQTFAPIQGQNDCVVLPYLRIIELEGAASVDDALSFLQQTPSEITPDATTGFRDSPTPRQFGEQAARDPQLKAE